MAKFINIHVVNGYTLAATNVSTPAMNGDNLFPADQITSVVCSLEANNSIPIATISLSSGKTITAGIAADQGSASSAPSDDVPTASDILSYLKGWVNKSITANPGGVKSTCSLGIDSDDQSGAKYDSALQLYWRSYVVS